MLQRLKSNKNILLLVIILVFWQPAQAEDLAYLVNLAMEVDATFKQAQENLHATMELVPQARADLLPLISATANTTYTSTNNQSTGPYNTFSYGATLTQPLLNLANWFKYQQAGSQVKSAIASYEDAKQDLIVRVAQQYFNILKALDDLNFARAERKAFGQHLAETKQKFNAGVIAITDVNEAQAKYDSAIAQEITADNEVSNQREIMGQITGTPAGNVSILKYNITLHRPHPDDIDYWVDTSLKQNYALQSKHFDAEAAKNNKEVQRAAHYPTIDATGTTSRGKNLPPPSQQNCNTNTVGLTLNIPIFNSGKINAKTRQAAYQYDVAIQQALDIQRQVVSNIRQSYRGVLTQIAQIKALQQSVISGKSALDATQAAFEVGTRTIVDVLNSQSDLLNAKSNLSKARYDYILDSFKLKRFAGILNMQDVNTINGWLQPSEADTKQKPVPDAKDLDKTGAGNDTNPNT